jgi:hypothetical protein
MEGGDGTMRHEMSHEWTGKNKLEGEHTKYTYLEKI